MNELLEQKISTQLLTLARTVGASEGARRNKAIGRIRRLARDIPTEILVSSIGINLTREIRNG